MKKLSALPDSDTIGVDQIADDIRMKEIEERFQILDTMTAALLAGQIRAMIVTGPPGVGKSYGIESQLAKCNIFDYMRTEKRYEVVKGAMTALGLYSKLYKYRNEGDMLVFDDCDSIFQDELSLNILKAALDSGKKRFIFWNADSYKLKYEQIPNSFEFCGTVFFITNVNFEHIRSKKLRAHLDALMSRCHYVDLSLDTMRDRLLRIKQIARSGALFSSYNFSDNTGDEILQFMYDNRHRLREVSLRTALKMADLAGLSNTDWKSLAVTTCMKGYKSP